MQISEDEMFLIRGYFRLDERILRVREHIKHLRMNFYDQTMLSHIFIDGMEIKNKAFRVDVNVVPFVDTLLAREESIKRLQKRKRYFNEYLDSLDPIDKEYLINKYSEQYPSRNVCQVELDILDEIREINDAICFMYGFPIEDRDLFIELDNANLEDDFDAIASMLGV